MIEKARLAISLYAHGRLLDGIVGSAKVVKAKNIRQGFNPEGREIFYTLREGYFFNVSDIPQVDGLEHGWRFYNAKTREKIARRIEEYCRDTEQNDEMNNVNFYE